MTDDYDPKRLTDEEIDWLAHRMDGLYETFKRDDVEEELEKLMVSYIQGMVECLVSIVRPKMATNEGAKILLALAKRAAGSIISDREEKEDPPQFDIRRN